MKLNIYLLKEGADIADAVKGARLESPFPVTVDGTMVGTMFPYRIPAHRPGWVSFFPEQSTELGGLMTSGAGGLAFLPRARVFVVAFGYASNQLNQDVVEEGFGLKVTLNSVPGDQLRSVDAYTPDMMVGARKHRRVEWARSPTLG